MRAALRLQWTIVTVTIAAIGGNKCRYFVDVCNNNRLKWLLNTSSRRLSPRSSVTEACGTPQLEQHDSDQANSSIKRKRSDETPQLSDSNDDEETPQSPPHPTQRRRLSIVNKYAGIAVEEVLSEDALGPRERVHHVEQEATCAYRREP